MSVDESYRALWAAMQRQRPEERGETDRTLKGGDGDGTSGDMEARIARLEASMDFVKAELNKLSGVPIELARISERITHMPTRIEVRADIDASVDRAAARTQRSIAIVGGLVTVAVAAINYLPKLLG